MSIGEIISLAAERERRSRRVPTRDEYRGALFEWRGLATSIAPADLVALVTLLGSVGARSVLDAHQKSQVQYRSQDRSST